MSDPGFTRSDLCSIRIAAGQAEFAGAFRGPLNADGYLSSDDCPLTPLALDIARTLAEAAFAIHPSGNLDRQPGIAGAYSATGHRGKQTDAGR